jgi:glycosyltransferase involved in cell wall biosynthesis
MLGKRLNILAIAAFQPMPDRSAGDLRFFEMLRGLAREHSVSLCIYDTIDWVNGSDQRGYSSMTEEIGVKVAANPVAAMKRTVFDVVLFEFHYAAERFIDDTRFLQPTARVIIDTVDLAFNRLLGKARITGSLMDQLAAVRVKRRELAAYAKADLVIAISEQEKALLQHALPGLPIKVVPLMQAVPPLAVRRQQAAPTLLFVANFHHEPNVDAIVYFGKEIFPLIERQIPDARLFVVGSSPPVAVQHLGRGNIEVLGFVRDLTPVFEASAISIAPLRYGGGLKGKICEAMANGLPVVSTSVGAEGFDLTPGENIMVGDTPESFAEAVVRLITDARLFDRIRGHGWTFVNERYSLLAGSRRIEDLTHSLATYPVKQPSLTLRLKRSLRRQLDRHLSWRIGAARD